LSFDGGGSSSSITAHKHSAGGGDGGTLDNTSLINSTSLQDSILVGVA
jgi:hypothetical protein